MNYSYSHLTATIFPRYFADLSKIQSSEANFASLLYYHLVVDGYQPTQLCTEMYTGNLVPDGIRPDLVIFDEGIAGRFNYYKDCEKAQDNTALKKKHLRCVVEIKGGAQQYESGLSKYFDDDLLCDRLRSDPKKRAITQNCRLAIDIEKLGMWASHFGHDRRDYFFLAIDLRNPKGFWPSSVRDTFGIYCAHHGAHLIYYAQGASSYWLYSADGTVATIALR